MTSFVIGTFDFENYSYRFGLGLEVRVSFGNSITCTICLHAATHRKCAKPFFIIYYRFVM